MIEILIIIALVAAVAWAVWKTVQRSRRGGACCGEHEETEKRAPVSDRNRSHYPYTAELAIGGMTCENCARKVENALNALPGVWAAVSIGTHSAKVFCKSEPDETALREAVRRAGYVVMSCGRDPSGTGGV